MCLSVRQRTKQNTRSFKNHHILPEFESLPQLLLFAPYLMRYLNREIIVPEGSFLYYEQICWGLYNEAISTYIVYLQNNKGLVKKFNLFKEW